MGAVWRFTALNAAGGHIATASVPGSIESFRNEPAKLLAEYPHAKIVVGHLSVGMVCVERDAEPDADPYAPEESTIGAYTVLSFEDGCAAAFRGGVMVKYGPEDDVRAYCVGGAPM